MDEDYNEFNSWDCAGAACMLAAVPAVLYYVFSGHDKIGSVILLGVAVGVGAFVYLAARLVGNRIVSRLMQLVGIALCLIYWVYAVHMWSANSKFAPPAPPPVEPVPADSAQ